MWLLICEYLLPVNEQTNELLQGIAVVSAENWLCHESSGSSPHNSPLHLHLYPMSVFLIPILSSFLSGMSGDLAE